MAVVGMILASLLTASLCLTLQFTAGEHTALMLMTREKYRSMLMRVAADLITAWWRARKNHRMSETLPRTHSNKIQSLLLLRQIKQRFRVVKHEAKLDVNETAPDTIKLLQILSKLKWMRDNVESFERRVRRLGAGTHPNDPLWERERRRSRSPRPDRRQAYPLDSPPLALKGGALGSPSNLAWKSVYALGDETPLPNIKSQPASRFFPSPPPASTGGERHQSRAEQRASRGELSTVPSQHSSHTGISVSELAEAAFRQKRTQDRMVIGVKIRKVCLLAFFFVRFADVRFTSLSYFMRVPLDSLLLQVELQAACFGCLGVFFAFMQDELLYRGGTSEHVIEALKAGNSISSIITVLFVIRLHWLHLYLQEAQAKRHLHFFQRTARSLKSRKASAWELIKRKAFWAEFAVNLFHLPPYVSFSVGSLQLDNYVVYRGETVCMLINTLRIYLLARVWKAWALSDLPKRYTIASWTGVRIGYRFALKRTIGPASIGIAWTLTLLYLGVWYRSAERTACLLQSTLHYGCAREDAQQWTLYGNQMDQKLQLYYSNAVWLCFITSVSVGYGDMYPITHLGRSVAAIAALAGIIFLAILTASLSNSIQWTTSESET